MLEMWINSPIIFIYWKIIIWYIYVHVFCCGRKEASFIRFLIGDAIWLALGCEPGDRRELVENHDNSKLKESVVINAFTLNQSGKKNALNALELKHFTVV